MAKLTDKQEAFCREYLVDLNATQAAIRAGYSVNTAGKIGSENLAKPEIQSYLSELKSIRNERNKIDADYVLRRLVEIDQMDVLDILTEDMSIKPVSQWPATWRRYISGFDVANMFEGGGDEREMVGILKKIKWPDKVKNLELLGKHVDVQAFKDKLETEHKGSINVVNYSPDDYKAATKALSDKLNLD